MKKKLGIVFILLTIIFSAIGITSLINDRDSKEGPVKAEGLKTTTKEKPTDGTKPLDYNSKDNIAIIAGELEKINFSAETIGEVKANVAYMPYIQNVHNIRQVKDNRAFVEALSESVFKSVGIQKYFFLNEKKVLTRNPDKINGENTTWSNNTPDVYSNSQYENIYGWLPNQLVSYIVCEETIINISDITNDNGSYSITVKLNPSNAPAHYQYEVKKYAQAKEFPQFSSIELEFIFDDSWSLKTINTNEIYDIKIPGLGSLECNATLTETFSYDNFEIKSQDYFESHKNLKPSQQDEVIEEELLPLDYLMYAFGNYLNGEICYFDINLALNDKIIKGKLYLDIKNLDIRFLSNNLNIFYKDNIIYLDYQGFKFKYDLNKAQAPLNENNIMDDLMNDLNNSEIIKEKDKIIMISKLNIFDIDINLIFNFRENKDDIVLDNILLNTQISDLNIKIDIFNVDKFSSEYNKDEFIDLNQLDFLKEDILSILKNKRLSLDLNIKYEEITLKGNIYIDFNNSLNIKANLNILYNNLNIDLNIVYKDNILNIKYNNLVLEGSVDDILNLLNTSYSNTSLSNIVNIILNINLNDFIKNLELKDNILTTNLDLSNIHPSLNNILIILSDTPEGFKLSSNLLELNLNINTLVSKEEVNYLDGNKIQINDLLKLVNNIFELYNNRYININLNGQININNIIYNIKAVLNIDIKEFKIKGHIELYYNDNFKHFIKIDYINNDIYLKYYNSQNFNSINIKTNINDLIEFINTNLDMNISINTSNIKDIINKILDTINLNNDNLSFSINDIKFNYDLVNNLIEINYINDNIVLNATLNNRDKFDIELDSNYLNLKDINYLFEDLINIYKNKQINLNISLSYKNIDIILKNLIIDFNNNLKLKADISIIYENNTYNIDLVYKDDYFTIKYLNHVIKGDLNDINNIIHRLSNNKSIDITNILNFDIFTILNDIKIFNNQLNISLNLESIFNDLSLINLNIKDSSEGFILTSNLYNLNINVISNKNNEDINHYVETIYLNDILNHIDILISYLSLKQYTLDLNGLVIINNINYNIKGTISLDILDTIKLNLKVELFNDNTYHYLELVYVDSYFYLTYKNQVDNLNSLKLKANINDLTEAIKKIKELIGIDFSYLSMLDINLNINDILMMITDIKIDKNSIFLLLNDSIELSLYNENNTLKGISIHNLNLKDIIINTDINFNDYNGDYNIIDEGYYDLSIINPFIDKTINTVNLRQYHLNGNLKINFNIIGINIDMNIDLDAKIKLLDNNKVALELTIANIPVIVGVNNDVPYSFGDTDGGQNRVLKIYIYENHVYLHRSEEVNRFLSKPRKYEKKLMITLEEFSSDIINYLLGYGLGLSDSILNSINSSTETNTQHKIDITNVLKGLEYNNIDKYLLSINLGELTGNTDLQNLDLNIYTTNINNITYLNKFTFDFGVSLASNINIHLLTDNINLINIGNDVDVSNVYNYKDSYPYNLGEKYHYQDNKWQKV